MQENPKRTSENVITLRGSADIVKEFFDCSVNSILYQRGIYPPESFRRVSKYGLSIMKTTDDELINYIGNILSQVQEWLVRGDIHKFVLVVTGVESGQTLERWVFKVVTNSEVKTNGPQAEQLLTSKKPESEINSEIAAIIRQITASVTFLPLLDQEQTSFDLLVYTSQGILVPSAWQDSDPHYIEPASSQSVQFRSFSTRLHEVKPVVSYRLRENK